MSIEIDDTQTVLPSSIRRDANTESVAAWHTIAVSALDDARPLPHHKAIRYTWQFNTLYILALCLQYGTACLQLQPSTSLTSNKCLCILCGVSPIPPTKQLRLFSDYIIDLFKIAVKANFDKQTETNIKDLKKKKSISIFFLNKNNGILAFILNGSFENREYFCTARRFFFSCSFATATSCFQLLIRVRRDTFCVHVRPMRT